MKRSVVIGTTTDSLATCKRRRGYNILKATGVGKERDPNSINCMPPNVGRFRIYTFRQDYLMFNFSFTLTTEIGTKAYVCSCTILFWLNLNMNHGI